MGLLSGLIGNASVMSPEQAAKNFGPILMPGETVELAFQLVRDSFVFTSSRLVLVNRQGITGSKVEYQSIPYRSIELFSVETAGNFDLDADLKIWVRGLPEPIKREFSRKVNVFEVQAFLAGKVG